MQLLFIFKIIKMKNHLFLNVLVFLSISLLLSCKIQKSSVTKPSGQIEIFDLATPIRLNYDTTEILLTDYFLNPAQIRDICMPAGLKILKRINKDKLVVLADSKLSPYDLISFSTNLGKYDIPILKSKKIKYIFTFPDAIHELKSVALAGEMNAWNPANNQMVFHGGVWSTNLYLEPDNYSYQLIVDGSQGLDPNNNVKIDNGMGGWNSVLTISNPAKSSVPELTTLYYKNDEIVLKINDIKSKVVSLFQNEKTENIIDKDLVKIKIPSSAQSIKRSYIRVRAYNDYYCSDEVFIPLDYGKVLNDSKQLTRQDKESNILYFMMVDRFNNAENSNDKPLNDPEVNWKADFHGGDIKGITEKIKTNYFSDLGVNCLWLSPIIKNPEGKYGLFDKNGFKSKFSAYHGYWPLTFTSIDYRFGTTGDLKELVSKAHDKNSNIILDIVSHHVHEKSPFYIKNKDKNWTTNLYLPDGSLNTERWDDQRLTTWFDIFLPTLNLGIPEVSHLLADSTVFWLKQFDVDGFRHDATKHIPLYFWRDLTAKVIQTSLETGKKYYQVGETYGTPELINSYIGSGMLDAQFDFNAFDAMLNTLIKKEVGFDVLKNRLLQSYSYYGVHNLMGNMTGNQDRVRFMALATGDVKFDEDGKLAGWSRNIEKVTKDGFQKLAMMHTLIMTLPGIPVIYYGDEIGLTGGNDPDNRRDMIFDNLSPEQLKLKSTVSQLTHLRCNNPVFLFGDINFIKAEKDIFVYSRHYFDKIAYILINTSNQDQNLSIDLEENVDNLKLKPIFNTRFTMTGKNVSLTIQPMSFEIIMN